MSTATRAQQKAAGWRKAMGDVKAKASKLVEYLDLPGSLTGHIGSVNDIDGVTPGDIVRRLVHLVDSADGNVRAEERGAWDQYMAALVSESSNDGDVRNAAMVADAMLEERRRRFAGGRDE